MTVAPTLAPPPRPTRHPVRRFLLVVATLALLAVVLWWTGAAAPRLSSPGGGSATSIDGDGTAEIEIFNDAMTGVDVVGVSFEGSVAEVLDFRVTARAGQGTRLPGRETATLTIDYHLDGCLPHRGDGPLVIEVRTVLGIERTVRLAHADLLPRCA